MSEYYKRLIIFYSIRHEHPLVLNSENLIFSHEIHEKTKEINARDAKDAMY